MNKIFKVIWSKSKQCYIVVSEIAKNKTGKKKIVVASILAALMMSTTIQEASAIVGSGSTNAFSSAPAGVAYQNGQGLAIGSNSTIASGNTNTVAIGISSAAYGSSSFAASGGSTTSSKAGQVAIGWSSTNGEGAVAIGGTSDTAGVRNTRATGNSAVALGLGSVANGNNTFAASGGNASGDGSIAVGKDSKAADSSATAIGSSALSGRGGVAVGWNSESNVNSVAAGFNAKAKANNTVAIGVEANNDNTISNNYSSVSVGVATRAREVGSMALGVSADASGKYSIALGSGDVNKDYTAGTNYPKAMGEKAIAIGYNAKAGAEKATALGADANANGLDSFAGASGTASGAASIAIGKVSKATDSSATALGSNATASGASSIAMGTSAVADSEKAIAIGDSAKGTNIGATALGRSSEASGASATALGSLAIAKGSTATAVGMQASASGTDSVAVGKTASATNNRALAVGTNAKATGENSVAVGSGSGGSGNQGFVGSLNSTGGAVNTTKTINYATTAEGDTAVAVGYYANAKNKGVAIGQTALAATGGVAIGKGVLEDTGNNGAGGVVIGQDSSSTGVYSLAMGRNAVASGSTSMAIGYAASADGGYAVAMGRKVSATGTSTAIGHHATATNGGLAIGSQDNDTSNDRTTASAKGAVAIGKNTQATKEDAVAIGTNAQATLQGAVALGSGSTTATGATNQGSTTINGITYNFAGATGNPNMQVSVGSAGATRQIKNVAAGEVSATSTDAINGSQLYAVASAIKPTKYVSIKSSATGSGSNVDNDGATGANSIAIGPSSAATNQDGVAFGNNAQSLSAYSIAIGTNAKAESGSGLTNASRAIAIGSNSRVATNVVQGIAIGSGSLPDEGAVVTGDQSIAIGGNVKVDGHGAIGIGGDDAKRAGSMLVTYTNTNNTQVTGTLRSAIQNLTGYDLSKFKGTTASHAGVAYGTSALAGNAGVAIGTASDSMTRKDDKGQVVNNKPVTNAVAIGTGARANFDNSVAIGGGSNTDHYATKQVNAIIDGVEVKWSGGENIAPGDVVSFGAKGFERQLKNVAPGEVSATSTDAINGSQIYSLARKVTNIMNGGSGSVVNVNAAGEPLSKVVTGTGASKVEKYYRTVDVNDDGTLVTGAVAQTPTALALVNVDQTNVNQQTQTPRTLGNVANGVKDNDAVNVSQLNAAKVKYFSVKSSDAGNVNNDGATGTDAIAIGPSATSNAVGSVALGKDAKANGDFTVALGGGNWQFKGAQANGVGTTALGSNTKTQDNINYQTAIGFGATTSAESALALGYNASATAQNAIALGQGASSTNQNSIAIGTNSSASSYNGVAIGAFSVADTKGGIDGYNANTSRTDKYAGLSGIALKSSTGAVSIGSSTITRQITNLAAGTNDTDAVNVAQLKSVNLAVKGNSGAGGDVNLATNPLTIKGNDDYITTSASGNTVNISGKVQNINVSNGTATATIGIADAKNVAEAINKAVSQNAYNWNLTADNDTAGSRSTINKEGTVKFSGDQNITVARNGNTITSSLKKAITVDTVKANNSVTTGSGTNQITLDGTTGAVTGNTFSGQSFTAGDNVLSNTTLQIGSSTNGNNVTITKDGLTSKAGTKTAKFGANGIDVAGQQITNVSSGGNVGTNAANITDVTNAVSAVTLKLDTNSKTGTVKLNESPLKVMGSNGIRTDLIGTNNGTLVIGLDQNTEKATTNGIGLSGDSGTMLRKFLKDGNADFKISGDGNLVSTSGTTAGVKVAVNTAKVKDLAVEAVTVSKANTADNPITVTPTTGTNSKDYAIGIDTTKLASKTDLTYRANNDTDANAKKVSLAKGLNFVNGNNTVATVAADGKVSYDLNTATKTKIDDSATAVARNISLGADRGTASSQSLKDGNVAFNVKGATGDYVSTNMNGNTVEISTTRATINSNANTGAASVTGNDGLATAKNVADAINKAADAAKAGAAWNLTTNSSTTDKTSVQGGDTVNLINGDNIVITQDGTDKKKITVATKKDLTVDSVTAGNTVINTSGLTNGTTAITGSGITTDKITVGGLSIDKTNGINAGGKIITNVASGNVNNNAIDNSNAANIGDVKQAVANLSQNLNITDGTNNGTVDLKNQKLNVAGANGVTATVNNQTITVGLDANTVNATTKGIGLTADSGSTGNKYLKDGDVSFAVTGDGNLVSTSATAAGVKVAVDAAKVKDLAVDAVTVSKDAQADNPITVTPTAGTNSKDYAIGIDTTKLAAKTDLTYRANSATDANAKKVSLSKGLDFVDGGSTVATVDNDGKVSFDLNTATKTQITTNTADIATNKGNITTNTTDIATNKGNITKNTTAIATNTANIAHTIALADDKGASTTAKSLKDGNVSFNIKGDNKFIATAASGNDVTLTVNEQAIKDAAKAASSFKVKANAHAEEEVKGGDTIAFNNGDNIEITQTGKTFTIGTAKDITVDSVTAGNTVINTSGLTNGTTAITGTGITTDTVIVGGLSIDKTNGINAGGKVISNVASGNVNNNATDNSNAANIGDVKQAVANLSQNLNITDGTNNGTVDLKNQKLNVAGANGVTATVNNQTITVGLDTDTVNATTKGIGLTADTGSTGNKYLKDGDVSFAVTGDGNLVNTSATAAGVKVAVDAAKIKDLAVDAVTVSKDAQADNPITVTPTAGTNSKDYAIGIDTTKLAAKTDLTYRANSATDANAKKVSLSKGLNFVDGGSTVATVDNDGKVSFDLNTATKNQINTNTTDIAANKGNITKNTAAIATNTAALARNISLGADAGTASSQSLSAADVAFNVKGATGDFVSTNMNGNTVEISTKRATINSNATTGEASVTGNDGLATAQNVADAINKAADAAKAGAAWNITTNSSTTDKTAVKGGDTVDLVNGDNIEITQDGTDKKKITVATKKDITVDSVTANNKVTVGSGANKITLDGTDGSVTGKAFTGTTFTGTSFTGTSFTAGNTVINTNGLTNGTTAITGTGVTTDNVTVGGISIDKTAGINAGNKVISNVASGGTTLTNAANIGDVQNAVANLSQNLNITDGTHDGTVDLKNQKLNVAGANGVTATVNNQTITVGLDANTVNATTKGIGLTADTGSTGNKYLKDGDVSFAVTGDGSLVSTSATAAGVKVAVNSASITAGADGTITGPTTDGVATAKNVADAINAAKKASKTEITANTGEAANATTGNVTLTSTTGADGHTIYDVKLNDKVTLGSGANAVTIDGTTGAITGKTATIGGVTVNGTANTIGGLSNTTWNGTAVSGRAATEDQLKAATGATLVLLH